MNEPIKYPILPPPGAKFNPEYFPEDIIALRNELEYHTDLKTRLSLQADKDVYIQLSEIAAFLNIVLDGAYTREDMVKLCGVMTRELQKRRTIIVL